MLNDEYHYLSLVHKNICRLDSFPFKIYFYSNCHISLSIKFKQQGGDCLWEGVGQGRACGGKWDSCN